MIGPGRMLYDKFRLIFIRLEKFDDDGVLNLRFV